MALRSGVVCGEDYAELVNTCKDGGYALAAVNCVGTGSINAVMEAAAKNNSDVIIQFSNGGTQFYAGAGMQDTFKAKVLGAVSAAQHVHLLAEHYGICVVLHTDHANRKLVPWVDALVDHSEEYYKEHSKALYSSHMLDLSEENIDDNLNECARMLERMSKLEMSLEIELGITGGEEDGVGHDIEEGADSSHLYTQPEDVLKAYDLLSPIGHFSVAASFGNVHGVYKPGNVQLRPEILKSSQELVRKTHGTNAKPLNLVFHGGSGSEKDKIAAAISYGVFKMNIDTDTQFAFSNGVGKYVEEHNQAFFHQINPADGIPQKKFYDPRKWLRAGEVSFMKRLDEAFDDLGSAGRSLAK
ncbi:MAG: class II fructose-bisphosphate aldolase [Kordiimonadaceae bacterium]|jgi:fructose-bisphosphate aldolase class II|nr:class II fructose-bisphosphate aldolase [Kordiimonadaceae bacterium]MDC0082158.1 class II fructose-bisphosphate aldolase [Emcibacteraceae bacterium]MDC1428578.1 class II fructose-bisphosphate aldolase [Emcibacteraceae bacterium]